MAAKHQLPPLLLLLLLLLFSLPLNSNSKTPTPSHPDLNTLLEIKQSWNNPPSLLSWSNSTSTSYCNWTGIHCSTGGAVTEIILHYQNITGPVPAAIASLSNLTTLDLYNNSISGNFPTSLYNCPSLQYLDLSENLLVGPLPADIDRLPTGLTMLILSGNNFSGQIPASITRLPAIVGLYLDNNLFNGSIPLEIGNLNKTLETLSLAYNLFQPASIPPGIANLSRLSYLWMTSANLIGEIPDSFSNLRELEHLDLAENAITGSIPAWIWNLTKLEYLYLFKNNFTGEINATGLTSLGLLRIDVSINQLEGSIPESFGELHNLSVLFMYYNNLSGQIHPSIGRLPSLTDLRLFNNQLTGPLPPELGKHSPLQNIEVDDNWLSGELPDGLCDKGALTSLVVFDNNLTGKLPASLGNCSKLDNIQIHRNGFSGDVPAGIWSAVNLTTVIMRDNNLSGVLPEALQWNMTRLEIQNNQFTGPVPSAAAKLLYFAAGDNRLSGDMRLATGMPLLQTLLLGGNLITGEIPSEFSSLKSLTELNLSSNRLTGGIPSAIGTLPVLTSLDLSINQLSGDIPTELGNLKLNFLNLSDNNLSGEIPAPLENAAYDRSFLSNNPALCATNSLVILPSCTSQSSNSKTVLSPAARLVLLLVGILLLAIAALFVFLLTKKRKSRWDPAEWKLTSFQSLDFSESNILRGLTDENLIGSGGAGRVYRVTGCSRAGGTVAVKKIWNSKRVDSKLEQEFLSEVKILGSIRHLNIVKLLCCVSSADEKLLVYEYMENGSLDRWLHGDRAPSRRLDWPTRLGIAIGAARGLSYMHHDCLPPVVHRDVKSSNILLDSEFRAQIADFGLARMLVRPGESHSVSAIAGSFGYMAPECAYTRKVNEKVDVYSFGVVLLELTTGRKANDDGGGGGQGSLVEWAWRHFQEGNKLADAIDAEIRDPLYLAEIGVVLKLGLICTGSLPSTRPTMKDVLQMLLCCDQAPVGMGDKSLVEQDVAPLLQTNKGSRHVKRSAPDDGDDDRVACNV